MSLAIIGIPVKLLHEAEGHTITVELKTGEVSSIRGALTLTRLLGRLLLRAAPARRTCVFLPHWAEAPLRPVATSRSRPPRGAGGRGGGHGRTILK